MFRCRHLDCRYSSLCHDGEEGRRTERVGKGAANRGTAYGVRVGDGTEASTGNCHYIFMLHIFLLKSIQHIANEEPLVCIFL